MDIIKEIQKLKQTDIKKLVDKRMQEFELLGKQTADRIFSEMCFCILTANYTAEGGIKIQNELCDSFSKLSQEQLASRLRKLGHRFPNTRARYISDSQTCKQQIMNTLDNMDEQDAREWLVKNIKGLGYKEASHFLRNIGKKNLAIIDFHIIDILVDNKVIEKPKTLTKSKYLEIESKLIEFAQKLDMNLAELDLYLWYLETGKILK
jgi:N-glycosylase/DNA lyase